jgi:hypothetical protein
MKNLFKYLPQIDAIKYTDYFLNKFLIESTFQEQLTKLTYARFTLSDLNTDTINELNKQLMSTFNFPPIDYALVFKHTVPQSIHIDGVNPVRYASLNLPLSGYENTKMIFYKSNLTVNDIIPIDAFYFPRDKVDYCGELPGSNNWVLINSSIPHQVVNCDFNNPRITLCFRFRNNPTFENLANLIKC